MGIYMSKKETQSLLLTVNKNLFKMDQRPKFKTQGYKVAGRKYRANALRHWWSDGTQSANETVSNRSFCTTKEMTNRVTVNRMRKKYLQTSYPTKDQYVEYTSNLKTLVTNKMINLVVKCAENFNRHVSGGKISMANKYMKKCSTSLAIREMQIKIMMKLYLTLIRMAKIKSKCVTNAEDVEKQRETLTHCYRHCSKQCRDFFKNCK